MFSSIRVRLTLWYLLVFGSLLLAFSLYIYSTVSSDMRRRFDLSMVRTAQQMASYFAEFEEQNNTQKGAEETIRDLREGNESAAIFREGQLLAANDEDVLAAIASTRILEPNPQSSGPKFATDSAANKRLCIMPFQFSGRNYIVAIFEPLNKLEGQIGHMRKLILFGLPAVLLLAAGGGFLVARRSLAQIVVISEQAEHIGARNLNERIKIANPDDELGRMAGVFNALLSRLDTSFRVMREFMADASHELRTPLTIVKGEADVSLSHDHTPAEYQQSLSIIRDQARRMGHIVSDLLSLARADAGDQKLRVEELYLNDLVEESCEAARPLATMKSIKLDYDAGDDLLFTGNQELLRRMIANLVDNAIRYTPEGGSVSVKLTAEPLRARLVVSDTGIGIPSEHIGRVFDRFYRVDDSRARAMGGSGLGLSIVKLAAESHEGTVEILSEVNRGSTFIVSLPL